MSIFQDFARRELADQYNSSLFTLLHCLSIRVAMAVKQSKLTFLNFKFKKKEIDQNDKMKPKELKLYKYIQHQIKKIKGLE